MTTRFFNTGVIEGCEVDGFPANTIATASGYVFGGGATAEPLAVIGTGAAWEAGYEDSDPVLGARLSFIADPVP